MTAEYHTVGNVPLDPNPIPLPSLVHVTLRSWETVFEELKVRMPVALRKEVLGWRQRLKGSRFKRGLHAQGAYVTKVLAAPSAFFLRIAPPNQDLQKK